MYLVGFRMSLIQVDFSLNKCWVHQHLIFKSVCFKQGEKGDQGPPGEMGPKGRTVSSSV